MMDWKISVLLVLAALLGAVITYFFVKRKSLVPSVKKFDDDKEGTIKNAESVSDKGKEELEDLIKQKRNLLDTYSGKINSLTDELNKAKEENGIFSQQINSLENKCKKSEEKVNDLNKIIESFQSGNIDEYAKQRISEVKKLKAEIEDLNEDVKDLEKDIKKYKDKLQQKEADYADLEKDKNKALEESKEMSKQLEEMKDEIHDKSQELNLKISSLSFIQEVLSAKEAHDEDTKRLYERINWIVSFVRDSLLDNIKQIYSNVDFFKSFVGPDLDRWAIEMKKSWIQGKTTVAFVGEFSAGKTSIVNRILSQNDSSVPLLPVSTKATTAIPTYITGSNHKAEYKFVTPSNILKRISETTFKKVSKAVLDEIKGVSSLIQYFVMSYENQKLNNLSILDTPGFNSNDKEDAERTIGVINECDALFWVVDVNAGTINRSSIRLIKKYLQKPLFVVINKVDTKSDSDVNSVEKLIRKTFSEEGLSIDSVIRFSSKVSLDKIMSPIQKLTSTQQNENFLINLESYLKCMIENLRVEVKKRYEKYTQINNEVSNSVDDMYQNINTIQQMCNDVASIPQYKSPVFWGNDRYEMTPEQYNIVTTCLSQDIPNYMNYLNATFQQLQNRISERELADVNYRTLRNDLNLLEDNVKLLSNNIKSFI